MCDPALEVTCPNEPLPGPSGLVKQAVHSLSPYFTDLVTSLLIGLVVLATMHVELFYDPGGRVEKLEAKIADVCKSKTVSNSLPQLCTEESSGKLYYDWISGAPTVVSGLVIVGMLFLLQLRRLF